MVTFKLRFKIPMSCRLTSPGTAARQPAVSEEAAKYPGKSVEVIATDEHGIGLKPVIRRVWASIGECPIAHGHHRFGQFENPRWDSPSLSAAL
jgi:hypothetical protein